MTFDADEGIYWLIAVIVALSVVSNILWVIIHMIARYEGRKPRPMSYLRNLKEIRQLFRNQDNPTRRKRYMFIMHLFDGCLWAVVVCFVVFVVLFFIGVLR